MFRATLCPTSGEVSFQPADQTPPIHSDKYQCRIDTVVSPDDGHMDARNLYRREINILSRFEHLVGLICKIVHGRRSTKHKIQLILLFIHLNSFMVESTWKRSRILIG